MCFLQEVKKFMETLRDEANKELMRKPSVRESDSKWTSFEIIFFYLQTEPKYLARLMVKHGEKQNGQSEPFNNNFFFLAFIRFNAGSVFC